MAIPAKTAKKAVPKRPVKKPVVTQLVSEFDFLKETPHTFRFEEAAEKADQIVGGFYLQKIPLEGAKPARVRVTVDILEFQGDKK